MRGRLQAHTQVGRDRSEEHTSELQSRSDLVCRLLLEKKKPDRSRWHSQASITSLRTTLLAPQVLDRVIRYRLARLSDDVCSGTCESSWYSTATPESVV